MVTPTQLSGPGAGGMFQCKCSHVTYRRGPPPEGNSHEARAVHPARGPAVGSPRPCAKQSQRQAPPFIHSPGAPRQTQGLGDVPMNQTRPTPPQELVALWGKAQVMGGDGTGQEMLGGGLPQASDIQKPGRLEVLPTRQRLEGEAVGVQARKRE